MNNSKLMILSLVIPTLFSCAFAMQDERDSVLGKRFEMTGALTPLPKKHCVLIDQPNPKINEPNAYGNTQLHETLLAWNPDAFCTEAEIVCLTIEEYREQGSNLGLINFQGKNCGDIILEKLIANNESENFLHALKTYLIYLANSTGTPIPHQLRTVLDTLESIQADSNSIVDDLIRNQDFAGFIAYITGLSNALAQLTDSNILKELQAFLCQLSPAKTEADIDALCDQLLKTTLKRAQDKDMNELCNKLGTVFINQS